MGSWGNESEPGTNKLYEKQIGSRMICLFRTLILSSMNPGKKRDSFFILTMLPTETPSKLL